MSSNNTAIATQAQPESKAFTMANIMGDPAVMDRMERMANMMASAKINVPMHFRGSPGDCFAVVMQATTWGMNPYIVAQKTFNINGVLGYEAQLVSAVINDSGAVKDRFHFEWFGQWEKIIGKFKEVESRTKKDDNGNPKKYIVPAWNQQDEVGLGIRVWATIKGEDEPRVLELLLTQARTRNSTLWTEDPKQQIAYLAQKRWARLYCPDVILGVYTPDEIVEQPEKFMGAAEVVTDTKVDGIPKELRDAALNASGQGLKSFQSWFKTLTPDQRVAIGPLRPECEAIWQKADANRTVDNPTATPAASPATAPATQGDAPVVTLKSVLDRMNSAKNMDGLDVAYDWANELTDPKEIEQTETLYATLKAKFGA